jgi:putative nucleotidyltransferase with HDIG domain
MPTTNELVTDIVQLPVRPGAAMRLLWMLDDSGASAADLGRVIDSDPLLSAHVRRLANTHFYGLSSEVSDPWRAVTVLGLATLRAVATTAAFDLFSDEGRPLPAGYWAHALTTAAAASTIARRVGVLPNEAFSLGLLHDIGTALVARRAPREFDELLEQPDLAAVHTRAGASALSVMRFSADMVEAVAEHHTAPRGVPSLLGRLLIAADAIALEVAGFDAETNTPVGAALDALSLPANAADVLLAEAVAARGALTSFLDASG